MKELAPGARVGHYEILDVIGAGGMGKVLRARDLKLGRDVALKVLPAEVADQPERLARFRREAQILASLSHPQIAAGRWTSVRTSGPSESCCSRCSRASGCSRARA